MTAVVRWWAIFCSLVGSFLYAAYSGGLTFVWEADHSKLSLVTLAVFWVMTAFVGFLTKKLTVDKDMSYEKYLPGCWFASDVLISLGMLGTLTGFLLMFSENMTGLNASDTEAVKQVIAAMSNGFSVGVITTICGIAASALLRVQLISLELK